MNILITGGWGFIGSNFIRYVLNKPEVNTIVNVDSHTYAARKSNIPEHPKIRNYSLDIVDNIAMTGVMESNKVTHIVHFAAESHVDNSIASPNKFIKTNVNGTFSLLEAARRLKGLVRFHHVSTDEVYGSLTKSDPKFTELTPYSPRSPYSASKASSDFLAQAYYHTFKLPVTISNCSNNYGPRQHEEKLIPKIIKSISAGKKVPIYGKGDNIRDWLYVDDHCEAIWEILTKTEACGEMYNVGGNCEKTNNEILESICEAMGVNLEDFREYVEDRKGHDFRYAVDFSKLSNTTGWIPKFSFSDGIKRTIDFYLSSSTGV